MMKNDTTHEVIFIGLPGPTHHYGGLSSDNVASSLNSGSISSPKQAALQVIALMRKLLESGITVGVLPPHLRPHLPLLGGQTPQNAVIRVLEKASSSSAMWVANAATIAPSCDTQDGILHITTANLHTNIHRRIEAEATYKILSTIFSHSANTIIHPPLNANAGLRDEGAANHMRFGAMGEQGFHVFVHGAENLSSDPASARHTLSASQALAAQHHLPPQNTLFLRQNPAAIEAGVFHNDVIAVSNDDLLLVHESAYANGRADIEKITAAKHVIVITNEQLSLEETVNTYFFNSQIITLPDGSMAVIAPSELESLYGGKAARLMNDIIADPSNPLSKLFVLDLRQSMKNGGGPACLRLRVPMLQSQIAAVRAHNQALVNEDILKKIEALVERYYPEKLSSEGLREPALLAACEALQAELLGVLGLAA